MQLHPIKSNLNFKARVELIEPKHLVSFLEGYPNITLRARMMQDALDALTLAKEKAPFVGTESDSWYFDFSEMAKNKDDFVKVTYNLEDKGFVNIGENPLIAVADMIRELTEGRIKTQESLKPFKLWQEFSYSETEGVLQRIRYKQKGNGRFTIAKIQKTTMEELTQGLKQLLGTD